HGCAPAQEGPARGGHAARLLWLRDPRRLRGRLRSGLRRRLPAPPLCRGARRVEAPHPHRRRTAPAVKLTLVTRRFPPLIGGAERVLGYLARALAAEGAEVTVLTARPPGLNVPETETEEPPRGGGRLTVVRLATSRLRFVGTWLYMRNLRRWLATHPVDLAYVSMLKHDAYVAVGEGRRRGFPVVLRPGGAGGRGDGARQDWGRVGPPPPGGR